VKEIRNKLIHIAQSNCAQ